MDAEEGFFGESAAGEELPNGFSQTGTGFPEAKPNQAAGGQSEGEWGAETTEGFETNYAEEQSFNQEQQQQEDAAGHLEGEQTYGGGYTHQQVFLRQYFDNHSPLQKRFKDLDRHADCNASALLPS